MACRVRSAVCLWVGDGEVEGGLGVEKCGLGVFVVGGEGVEAGGEEGVVGCDGGGEEGVSSYGGGEAVGGFLGC